MRRSWCGKDRDTIRGFENDTLSCYVDPPHKDIIRIPVVLSSTGPTITLTLIAPLQSRIPAAILNSCVAPSPMQSSPGLRIAFNGTGRMNSTLKEACMHPVLAGNQICTRGSSRPPRSMQARNYHTPPQPRGPGLATSRCIHTKSKIDYLRSLSCLSNPKYTCRNEWTSA